MDNKNKPMGKRIARHGQMIIIMALVFAVGVFFGSQNSTILAQNDRTQLPAEAQEAFEPLFETFNLINSQYIDEQTTIDLVDGAIRGMVESLDDPYSNYVDAQDFPFVDSNLSGEIEGIGVVITENEETGEIEIVNVLEGTPAERSGLKEGDIFITVNGEDAVGWTYLELASRVRGEAGTTVDITMRRDGALLDFTVERARIEIPNIETELLEGDIAYISLAQFTNNAREQIDAALAGFDLDSANGLILDLRGNPGGLLTTATEIAALLLEEGTILIEEFGDGEERIFEVREGTVYEVFSDGSERVYSQNAAYIGSDVPVVVLVDGRSASASELVSGAWQDSTDVTILGSTTFGKGTVQIQNTLVNGGGVRLTVARWLTPNGLSISEQGVTPDIIIEIPEGAELEEGEDPQLEAALQFLLTGEVPPVESESGVTEMQLE